MNKISIKTKEELEIMTEGGHILANIIKDMKEASHIGTSTQELDDLANKLCKEYGVIPGTKGYMGFPASFCPCINDVVVHGIPSKYDTLKDGDVFTIDMVIKHKGLYLDAAITIPIGDVSDENLEFLSTVKKARDDAIAKVKPGRTTGDLSAIIEFDVRSKGYSPVKEMTGHGIGYEMHEDPEIPSYGFPGTGVKLQEGMVIAVEAIIAKGEGAINISRKDGWTATTKDGSIAAVFEHTLAITKDGHKILTI